MLQSVLQELTIGFGMTLELFVITLIGAIPLGLVVAFGSMSKIKPIKYLAKAFVWVMRGTPLMLQLIIVYYGPGLLFGTNIWGMGTTGRFIAVVVAFVINYAAYFSEIYRGGIESIPQGQYEAGQMLGLTKTQIFFRVILLQVVKRIITPMSNEIITLVKDTSLARVIAVYEVIWMGQAFIKSDGIIWPLFMTGLYYLAFTGVLTVLLAKLEDKFSYFN
ncbi:MAG: amino acid ABC transporter permease [Clostridiales bacterium]|jgi:polar amino acid transport system permease protein|nr:amino acid ABC transporter permease [Clostridiales bacterium]